MGESKKFVVVIWTRVRIKPRSGSNLLTANITPKIYPMANKPAIPKTYDTITKKLYHGALLFEPYYKGQRD